MTINSQIEELPLPPDYENNHKLYRVRRLFVILIAIIHFSLLLEEISNLKVHYHRSRSLANRFVFQLLYSLQ